MTQTRVAILGNHGSVHVVRWIEEMQRRDIQCVVLSEHPPTGDLEWEPLEVSAWVPRGFGMRTRAAGSAVARALTSAGCDILHTHFVGGLAHAAEASGFRPRVLTVWGSDVFGLEQRPARTVRRSRAALAGADLVTCGSHALLDAAIAAGARPECCVLVGWGVDTELFRPDAESRARVRSALGLAHDTPVLISSRHLSDLYRIDSVVRAFAHVRASVPEAVLLVIGDGPQRDSLEALAREQGSGEAVRFIGRLGSEQDVAEYLPAGDVYISVPRSDGGPISVLEAMASGLPVVASDLPANAEWIEPGVTGELWAGSDEASLADAIVSAFARSTALGVAARDRIQATAERRAQMDRMADFYRQLAASRGVVP